MAHDTFRSAIPNTNTAVMASSSVRSVMETLANAVSELQKTYGELTTRLSPVIENSPVSDGACEKGPMPARLSPNACSLSCSIDNEAERIEKLAGEMYRLSQSIQL